MPFESVSQTAEQNPPLASTRQGSGQRPRPLRRRARHWLAMLGLLPFSAYVLIFFALPAVLAMLSGLFDANGALTFANFSVLGDPAILSTLWNSIWISVVTAAIGVAVGFVVCWAMLGMKKNGIVRSAINAVSGTLSQFGGIMLAFAFVATIGLQGVLTSAIHQWFHIDIFANGAWIYDLPGIVVVYIYFQVPLMVMTFMPSMEALHPQWCEATLTLGGTRWTFWRKVGFPVLWPSILSSFLLLFANAFSSYATAAALISQGSQIVSLQIRAALTSETVLGRQNVAGVLALAMVVTMIIVMTAYSFVDRKASRWMR